MLELEKTLETSSAGLILEYQPTMLLVEHDRSFLNAVATRVVRLERRESR